MEMKQAVRRVRMSRLIRKGHPRLSLIGVLLAALCLVYLITTWQLGMNNIFPFLEKGPKSVVMHSAMEVLQARWSGLSNSRPHTASGMMKEKCVSNPKGNSSKAYRLDPHHLEKLATSLQLDLGQAWVSQAPSLFAKEEFEDLKMPQFQARVPALVFFKDTFLAFCEARFDSVQDWGNMMIGLRRGNLKGREVTWERIRVIAGIPEHRTMNPTPIVDRKNNAIVLVFSAFPTHMTYLDLMKHAGQPMSRLYVMKSNDVGLTWSDPVDITNQTIGKIKPFPVLYAPGPGHSLQMNCGRIVVPGNFFTTEERRRGISGMCSNCINLSNILYSDDGGTTWHLGARTAPAQDASGASIYPNEAQLAEFDDGTLYMNLRTLDSVQPRAYCRSYDGGQTLTRIKLHPTLVEPGYRRKNKAWKPALPGGCHASTISVNISTPTPVPTPQKTWLVFSNPADPLERVNQGIRLSVDGGTSWSNPWIIFPYKSAYSDLVYFDKTTAAGKREHYFAVVFEDMQGDARQSYLKVL
ncbi:sialidase-3-like isoform X2 [Acanthaster planci]|uniref:Sialidase-3-like isoform X2 n=1 Tax=Acanthaster planci TaxID=133434 RepID=A0A8B8A4H9_ACAPL|nr:sialidase-3-like isoform X2 [Acanthaster planci]